MRAFLATVLSVIAVGVLLIAYGLLAPRASASPQVVYDPQTGIYHLARPMLANEQITLSGSGSYGYQGQSLPYATPVGYPQQVYTTTAAPARFVETPVSNVPRAVPTAQRTVTRVERPAGRNWQKTALVIGGSTATGAGIGAIVGGKKGALIGAAIGGGASTLYEAKQAR
jgi:hypothetical protein